MALVHLGLGSNLDRARHISAGVNALQLDTELGATSFRCSRVFESAAVGFAGSDFYNLVVSFHTHRSVQDVQQICKTIEMAHGHHPDAPKYSPRTLDIDVLLYDDMQRRADPQLPRAEILENAFVLWPLAELSPLLVHPTENLCYWQLWQAFSGSTLLHPIDFEFISPASRAHAGR